MEVIKITIHFYGKHFLVQLYSETIIANAPTIFISVHNSLIYQIFEEKNKHYALK